MPKNEKTMEVSLMTGIAAAIAQRSGPVPGKFRLGFQDGFIECIGEREPAPGFIQVAIFSSRSLDQGFTAEQWLVLGAKMAHAYKEKVECQKQCKSSTQKNLLD